MDTVLRLAPSTRPDEALEPLWREVVGPQLRRERRARGARISDIAKRAGLSPQYLSELERGKKDPSSEVLAALAGALGLTVLDLTRRAATQVTTTQLTTVPRSAGRGPSCSLALAA